MQEQERPQELDGPIQLAGFRFDPRAGELSSEQGVVRLGEKPAAALAALLIAPGTVVDRGTLVRHLWPDGTVVDYDNNLNAAIKKLRDALGDDAEQPRFIETLPRRGYRFIGPVQRMEEPARMLASGSGVGAQSVTSVQAGASAQTGARTQTGTRAQTETTAQTGAEVAVRDSPAVGAASWRPRPWLLLGLGLLVALSLALLVQRGWGGKTLPPAPMGPQRLLVLPFGALANGNEPEPDDWLRDGLTEETITLLGRLQPEQLGVIARHSAMQYRDRSATLEEIGRAVDVGWVVDGTVAAAGERVRVSVSLIRTDQSVVAWAERFEERRGDTELLVRRVAAGIATAVAERLLAGDSEARVRAGSLSSEAYESYLIGRRAWHRFTTEGYQEAQEAFERALAADPDFAPAHAALADTFNLIAFTGTVPKEEAFAAAFTAAQDALARDPDLAAAHNALAFARLYGKWDVSGSLSHFARAVELDPNYAMAHHWRAGALAIAGRVNEAVAAAQRALELDPLSLSVTSDLGWYLIYADRYQEARTLCMETLAEHPNYRWARACAIEAARALGEHATAAEEIWQQLSPTEVERNTMPDLDSQDPRTQLAALDHLVLQRKADDPNPSPLNLAENHARLGDLDQTFIWLERTLDRRDPWILFLPVQPFFDVLHGDPRLDSLAQRIGLPGEVRKKL